MSTNRFADHVTSVGFSLTLTKHQIQVVNSLLSKSKGHYIAGPTCNWSMMALVHKGIIEMTDEGYNLTEAAMLIVPVLEYCGLLTKEKKLSFKRLQNELEKLNKERETV